jgi:hypothetical protein
LEKNDSRERRAALFLLVIPAKAGNPFCFLEIKMDPGLTRAVLALALGPAALFARAPARAVAGMTELLAVHQSLTSFRHRRANMGRWLRR